MCLATSPIPSRASEAEVIHRLNMIAARLDGWTAEIKSDLAAKYNPRQPRAPRGTPIGGQWVDSGGGQSSGGARFGVRKPARDPWLHDAMTNKPPYRRRPEDILEEGGAGAVRAAEACVRHVRHRHQQHQCPNRRSPIRLCPSCKSSTAKVPMICKT